MSHQIPPQHILVVDDEPMIRAALEMVLIDQGHTVDLASDGSEALDKIAKRKYDVIFTDLNMPEMLGDELARRIRKQSPHQVIVMISAYTNFLTSHHKKKIPVDFLINKPFELQNIFQALAAAHEINKANRKKVEP
jgi:CheY-like chemotaxis protein